MKIIFADDVSFRTPVGPLWIFSMLTMKVKTRAGRKVLKVVSPTMRTQPDSPATKLYPDSDSMHYCKLMSPARVMEWIYTDGLREDLGY
jgi:hypothetical protein